MNMPLSPARISDHAFAPYDTRARAAALWLTVSTLLVACATSGAHAEPGAGPRVQSAQSAKLTDAAITRAVEAELDHDRAVRAPEISVSAADGIVTLDGNVGNLMAKERAMRLAETVKGVRTVISRIQTRPTINLSDHDLRQDIRDALFYDRATDSYEIGVYVKDGNVRLMGEVQSFAERQLAERVAKSVNGARSVDNRITVKPASERPAAEIKADVVKRLRWDALVGHEAIAVTVNEDGQVELAGNVGSASEKTRASSDAWVAGVKSVGTRDLHVASWADDPKRRNSYTPATDREIEAAISEALKLDPRAVGSVITPESIAGAVVLRGVVDSIQARNSAGQIARSTTGVVKVTNRIRIEPVRLADARIQNRVISALARDPYLDSYDVSVDVVGGVVFLAGTADSYFEKMEADRVASRAAGIRRVNNNMKVLRSSEPLVYNPYVTDSNPYDYEWYDYQPYRSHVGDKAIHDDIESEMWWSPFVDGFQVTVTVNDGIATLEGRVDSYEERRAAVANAYEGGAVWVDDKLTVRRLAPPAQ